MKDANKRRRFFSLFLNLTAVSKKSTPVKFTYIWHFERNRINAKKFEKKRKFTDVLWLPSPSSMLNLPNIMELRTSLWRTYFACPLADQGLERPLQHQSSVHPPPPPSLTISFFVVSTYRGSTVIISMVNKHKNTYSHFCSEHQRSGP